MTESCTPATPEPRATNPTELNNLRAAHADELSSRTRATSIPQTPAPSTTTRRSAAPPDAPPPGWRSSTWASGAATCWDGSALGEELSEALGEAVSQAGLKFLLIRQVGRAGRVLHGAPGSSATRPTGDSTALCSPG